MLLKRQDLRENLILHSFSLIVNFIYLFIKLFFKKKKFVGVYKLGHQESGGGKRGNSKLGWE